MIGMDDRHSSRQMIGTLAFLLTGPILWAADLTAIYGAQSSLCAFGAIGPNSIGWLVIATSALLLLADIIALARPRMVFHLLTGTSPPDESQWTFLAGVMRVLAGLSALTITYFALAAVLLRACAQLR